MADKYLQQLESFVLAQPEFRGAEYKKDILLPNPTDPEITDHLKDLATVDQMGDKKLQLEINTRDVIYLCIYKYSVTPRTVGMLYLIDMLYRLTFNPTKRVITRLFSYNRDPSTAYLCEKQGIDYRYIYK